MAPRPHDRAPAPPVAAAATVPAALRPAAAREAWWVAVAVVTLGALYGVLFLSWDFVTASVNDGDVVFEADRTNAVVGLNYFVQDAWRFPVLDVARLAEDSGANVIFTDSVPLLALPLKAAYPWHRRLVDPYGGYLVLCFALQAGAFSFLLAQAGERRPAVHVAAALLACSTPALLNRWGHVALCSHYLPIAMLALYLRSRRAGRLRSSLAAMAAVLVASLLVHAYLAAMGIAVLAVALLQARLDRRLRTPATLLALAALAAGVGALLPVLGYVRPGGAPAIGGGYGAYALNLLAPFWPEGSRLTGMEAIGRWGFEGVLYLGTGALGLLVVALLAAPRTLLGMVGRHRLLAALAVGLAIVAASHVVRLGPLELFAWRQPDALAPLFATFRASARFFWPVIYLLLVASICAVARRFRPVAAVAWIAGAAALQVVDTLPFRRPVAATVRGASAENRRQLASLVALARAHPKVCFHPAHAQLASHGERVAAMRLLLASSLAGVPTNDAYLARPVRRHAPPSELAGVARACPPDALLAFAPTRSDVAFARWELGRPVFRGDRLALAARRDAPAAAVAGLGRLPRGARLRRR